MTSAWTRGPLWLGNMTFPYTAMPLRSLRSSGNVLVFNVCSLSLVIDKKYSHIALAYTVV